MPDHPAAKREIEWGEVAATGLFAVAVLVRVAAVFLPQLAETNYEEAEAGLMARDVLRGDYIALWRGVPYLGTLHVYLAAALFAILGATTPVLRLAPLLLSLVAAFFAYRLARALFGPGWALLTLAWWAIPPAFLTRLSVTPYNYVGSVAWGTAILYLTHRAVSRRPASPGVFGLLGLFSGIALWDHLISLCVLAASGLWLLGAAVRRGARPPARAQGAWLAGFLLGSAPLWLWNAAHRFETVTALLWPGVGPAQPPLARLAQVAANLVDLLGRAGYFWADLGGASLQGAVVALVYLPALAYLVVGLAVASARRLAGKPGRPWEPPAGMGLVFTAFVLACVQYAWSRHDGERYLMPVYASVPVLLAGFARALASAGRWPVVLLVVALLSIHAIDNARLARAGAGLPPRPADAVIAFLLGHDVRHVYAHHRVAWPLGFESAERITASDLHGYLTNRYHLRAGGQSDITPFLRAMEAVDLAPRVAFVTHDVLGLPTAADLEMALRLLGGASRQTRLGPYTVFWDFQPPAERIREIPPALISLRASHGSDGTPFALDRHIATTWKSGIHHQVPGMVVEATLDRPRRVAKIVLDPGNFVRDYPRGLRVESSLDGRTWQELVAVPHHLGGIDWLGGHPKLNLKGRIGVSVGPVEARHVRLTQIGNTGERVRWTIAELLLYEADPRPAAAGADGVPTPAERPAVFGLLRGAAVEALYSSDEGHVYFGRHLPASIRTVRLRDRRDDPVQRSERVVRPERRNAFFLPSESPLLEADFRAHGLEVVTHRFAGGILYLATARRPSDPLYWGHGRLMRLVLPPVGRAASADAGRR